jgi:hypothetical protein
VLRTFTLVGARFLFQRRLWSAQMFRTMVRRSRKFVRGVPGFELLLPRCRKGRRIENQLAMDC